MNRRAEGRDWADVSVTLTVIGLLAAFAWWLIGKFTSSIEARAADKRRKEAADAQSVANAEMAQNAEARRADLEARCNGGDKAACTELAEATTRAREARAAAEAAERERLRREQPCAVEPDSLACRHDRIAKGDKSECAACQSGQPVFGMDMDKAYDVAYTKHAQQCCPIKGACNEAGAGFRTRERFGRIYEPNETGC